MNEIRYVEGDLFAEIKKTPVGSKILIPHVVNNIGKWGAGFSGKLGEVFPTAKRVYLIHFGDGYEGVRAKGVLTLGYTQAAIVGEDIRVANMVAQDGVGTDSRKLRYHHLASCMGLVGDLCSDFGYKIHCPKFGCGLAGGDWRIIEQLIIDCWIRRGIEVTVYWLPEKVTKNHGGLFHGLV